MATAWRGYRLWKALPIAALPLVVFAIFHASGARANSLVVGSGAYPSIQAAVNSAANGDTILVHAGTYNEQVTLNKAVTLAPYGDGAVWVNGSCSNTYGIDITASGTTVQGLGVENVVEIGILIDNGVAHAVVTGNTVQDFDCKWTPSTSTSDPSWSQYYAGIGAWYSGCCETVTNNTIHFRSSGPTRGPADDIWFKSNSTYPSGGGHLIKGNIIDGGWDGIGGEVESDRHGAFDQNTTIQQNTVSTCWDDGIQVDGGNANNKVDSNTITGCADGISFNPVNTGPLSITNNHISAGVQGYFGGLQCFKTGGYTAGVVVTLSGNVCDQTTTPDQSADGIQQTNPGIPQISSSNNTYHVTRYVFEFGEDPPNASFDHDCLSTSDSAGQFMIWDGTRYDLPGFQTATGQETHATCAAGR